MTASPCSWAARACTCAPWPVAWTSTRSPTTRRCGRGSRPSWSARVLTALVQRLRAIAPILAAETDLANPRRVLRALEIAEIRGDGPRPVPRGYDGPVAWLGLTVERAEHERRIAARARQQFDDGLVAEAVALRERYDPGLPAFSAIGYHEAWEVADGTRTLEEAVALDAQRNVAFAKRQRTWFRSEPGITWLDATDGDPFEAALEHARRATG